jgi:AraC family transcriptional regulator of adaptative response / DNA-3-methyladenine glycosylase II
MRVLGDPDAFPAGDLGVRRALERLGHPGDPIAARRRAERWRPWRAYGLMYLWSALELAPPRRSHVSRRSRVLSAQPAALAGVA